MKRHMLVSTLLLALCMGCKPAHPAKVLQDPAFEPNKVRGVLVAPFISSIIEAEDPQRQSEKIMNKVLAELLTERVDYKFMSPDQFHAAVARAGLGEKYAFFKERWATKHEIDKDFVLQLKGAMNADVLLLPHVYLWHKDEADYRETATNSVTQVGATIVLIDMASAKTLWEGSDENYREAVRSEDRSVVTSGGVDRRVGGVTGTGHDMYAAPPYDDVAQLVLKALIDALPKRAATQ